MYIYIGEKAKWHIYVPCLQINTQKYFQFFFILNVYCYKEVTKKCFFINIFIFGRSGVKEVNE